MRCVVGRVEAFGAFVHLAEEPAVDGFIHRTKWSWCGPPRHWTNMALVGGRLVGQRRRVAAAVLLKKGPARALRSRHAL